MPQAGTRPGIIIEAHRGNSSCAPENTLAAFRQAVALGARWIELDTHLTRDGFPVVIHDGKLERTTTGKGAVKDLTADEVRRADAGRWFGAEFASERVPLLTEVLELVQGTATRLNIEIKGEFPAPGMPARIVETVRPFPQHMVSSFSLPILLAFRGLDPARTLALIGHGPVILAQAKEHGLPWIHAFYRSTNLDVVAGAHTAGIRVNVWTLDDPGLFAHYRRLGVDKICSNRPARLMAAAEAVA